MISIEQCRELIPNDAELTDKQIEDIRENLNGLAELALESYFKQEGMAGGS